MPSMTFNEFQKELNKRISDPQVVYMLTFMFEQLVNLQQQQEQVGTVLVQFADQLSSFVSLHERTQEGLQKILRGGRPDGVEVMSAALDDPDKKH